MGEQTLDIQEIVRIIKKRSWIIVSIIGLSVFISLVMSYLIITPTYEANTSIIIGKTGASGKEEIQYNDVMMYQKLVKTYSDIAKSRTVSKKTSEKLENIITPEEIIEKLNIAAQTDTQIMIFKMQGKKSEEITKILNTHAQVFINESQRLYPSGSVQIMDEAVLPRKPIKPNAKLNLVIAFFMSILFSLGVVLILEYMDNTIKSTKDIEKLLNLPVIGTIPKIHE